MKILVLNCGSSSVKYQVVDTRDRARVASGQVERIGADHDSPAADHREALALVFERLQGQGLLSGADAVAGIAHRVVHGGEHLVAPVRVNADVIAAIGDVADLAPLHNPANLLGIEVAAELLADVPQVAVFDTAFHSSLPARAFTYAIPERLQGEPRIRRYGFHGSSHAFVSRAAAEYLQRPLESLRLITLHLGNGASVAAIRAGQCIDTSMGFTPLEGLVMGTRSGDLDASILTYLATRDGLTPAALDRMLNEESGLLGLCGVGDMREVMAQADATNERAQLAIDVFCYRITKYIGAYAAALGGLDGLVFTAGIGQHAPDVRQRCCEGLGFLGIELNDEANRLDSRDARDISQPDGSVRVLVIPTDEELEIALAAVAVIGDTS